MSEPPRIVLDTNAALDVLLFADPRSATLASALARGQVQAVTNARCTAEWRRVLRYPALRLSEDDIARLEAAHETLCRVVEHAVEGRLPRCRDPDDQCFLELARDAGAVALLTRDAELLRLARRTAFAILAPESFLAE